MRQGRVLVVDDDVRSAELMKRLLEPQYEVLLAENALEAERILDTENGVDVIVCDEVMPGERGLTFCTRLHRRGHPAVRILVTGHVELALAVQAVNERALYLLLQKPVAAAVLQQAVRDGMQEFHCRSRSSSVPGIPPKTIRRLARSRNSLGLFAAIASVLMVLGVTLIGGLLVLAVLYIVKSMLGIDIFPDRHLSDFF